MSPIPGFASFKSGPQLPSFYIFRPKWAEEASHFNKTQQQGRCDASYAFAPSKQGQSRLGNAHTICKFVDRTRHYHANSIPHYILNEESHGVGISSSA